MEKNIEEIHRNLLFSEMAFNRLKIKGGSFLDHFNDLLNEYNIPINIEFLEELYIGMGNLVDLEKNPEKINKRIRKINRIREK